MNKKTKRLFSLLLALVMIMTAIPITAIPVTAASASPTLSKFGVMKSHSGQWDDRLDETNKISNVIWDSHGSGNQKYSVAFWVYDISNIPQYADITSGTVNVRVEAYTNNTLNQSGKNLEYYWIPQTHKDDTYITQSTSASGTEYTDSSFSFIGNSISNINSLHDKFIERYSDAELMFSIAQTTAPRDENGNDIKSALQKAVDNGDDQFIVAAIHNTYFDAALPDGSDKLWSDNKVKAPVMSVDYTVNSSDLTVADWGVVKKKDGQYDDRLDPTAETINVIWDDRGNDSNGSVAFWVYDLSGFSGKDIKASTISVNVSAYEVTNKTNKYVDFYWIPYSYITDDYISHALSEADQEYCPSTFFSGNIANFATDFTTRYSGATKIYSVQHTTTGDAPSASITDAISSAVAKGDQQFILAAIQRSSFSSSDGWSDSKFKKPTINITYREKPQNPYYNNTTINKDNNENAVTGRVTIDNVIYTSASDNTKNYGTYISQTDPYNTQITIKSGYTLNKIELVDANGKQLSFTDVTTTGGKQTTFLEKQDMGLDKYNVRDDKNVTATLRFVFSDGKIEYHRVAVKSIPVEAHLVLTSQTWSAGQTETGFETRFLDSYGSVDKMTQTPTSSTSHYTGNWDELGNVLNSGTTTARGGNYYSQYHMVQNDKIAGYGTFRDEENTPTNVVPTARYYIDKSNTNLANGNLWSTTNSNYSIVVQNTRWVRYYANTKAANECSLNVVTSPDGGSFDRTSFTGLNTDKNGDFYSIKYSHNGSINTDASQTNVVIRIKCSTHYIEPKVKLAVNVFDKSTTRTAYNNAVDNAKYNSDSKFTASAYADYLNALLEAEAYLSNFEITTSEGLSTDYKTNIYNAQSALDENSGLRGDVQNIINACNEAYPKTNDTQYTQASRNSLLSTLDSLTYVSRSGSTFTSTVANPREFSKENEISDINKITTAVNNLVGPADWTALDAAYNRADQILTSLNGADAVYTSSSLQALIDAVNRANLEGVMTPSNRPNTFSDSQHTIDANTERITNALNGLTEPTADLSTYKAMNNWLDNYDKDVYGLTNEQLTTAQSGLDNAALASDLTYNNTVNGHTATLNVFRDDIDSQATQTAIDTAIGTAMTTMNDNIVAYDLTVTDAASSLASNNDVAYGTRVTFTATDSNKDTAWYMSYNSTDATRTQQYQGTGSTYSLNVFGNITVVAHSRTDATPNKVTITKKYTGTTQDSGLELIDFVGSSYTLPTPSAVAGYAFQNYTVNGETKAAGDEIKITKDTSITANYEYNGTQYTVSIDGTSTNHKYNDKIELKADDGKVWLQNIAANTYRVFYNEPTATFYVVGNITLISVNSANLGNYTISEKPIYLLNDGTMVAEHKLVFNGQVVAPEGKTVKEYGVLVGKPMGDNGALTAEDVKVENAGDNGTYKILRAKSTKSYGADQFTIRVGGLENQTGVIYKGYVILEDNASHQITTVYTDAKYYNN